MDNDEKKQPWYKNSVVVFIILVGAALTFRFLVFEAFKIPTGSMEPTLLGDEAYGDRLFVNKTSYILGRTPQRWDVAVFEPPADALAATGRSQAKRYVKRVCGLPGDDLLIAGGDLWKKNDSRRYEILRKPDDVQAILWHPVWKFPPDSNHDRLKAFAVPETIPTLPHPRPASDWYALSAPDGCRFNEAGDILLVSDPASADGTVIRYAHPITNLYVKGGRHYFNDKPPSLSDSSVRSPDSSASGLSSPSATSASPFAGAFNRYVRGGWEGVLTPPSAAYPEGRRIFPIRSSDMFWGNMTAFRVDKLVGQSDPEEASGHIGGGGQYALDIRVELTLRVIEPTGRLELVWRESPDNPASASELSHGIILSLDGDSQQLVARHRSAPGVPDDAKRDGASGMVASVNKRLSDGAAHTIVFEHIDGSLRLSVDGQRAVWDYERTPGGLTRFDDVRIWAERLGVSDPTVPRLRALYYPQLDVKVVGGGSVSISALNIYRDLHYIADKEDLSSLFLQTSGIRREIGFRRFEFDGLQFPDALRIDLEKGKYAMLGDNAPMSFDSRSWGPVDEIAFKGKATLRWWPVTRWGLIK